MVDGSPSVCLREFTQVCGSAYHTCYPPWWRDQFFEIAYTSTTPCPTELYEIVWAIQLYSLYSVYIFIHHYTSYSFIQRLYSLYIIHHYTLPLMLIRRVLGRPRRHPACPRPGFLLGVGVISENDFSPSGVCFLKKFFEIYQISLATQCGARCMQA